MHIDSYVFSGNIVDTATYSENLYKLRYFYVEEIKGESDIVLDISVEFPGELRVFNVVSNGKLAPDAPNEFHYGKVDGDDEEKRLLEQNLIH